MIILAVTIVEAIVIYKIRYVFSRKPIWGIGLVIAVVIVFYLISKISLNKFLGAYSFGLASLDLFFLVIMFSYMWMMHRDKKRAKINSEADFLLVMGNKCMTERIPPILMSRLNKAIELFRNAKVKPQIIVSGGKNLYSLSNKSEATMMKEYLVERDIPLDRIVTEEKAMNTMQNLEFSSIKIYQMWSKDVRPRVIIVTSDYHLPRTRMQANTLGFNVQYAYSETIGMLKWPAMFREFTAFLWHDRYAIAIVVGIDVLYSLSLFI